MTWTILGKGRGQESYTVEEIERQLAAGQLRGNEKIRSTEDAECKTVQAALAKYLPDSPYAIRLTYLQHETSLRSIGTWFCFSGALLALTASCSLPPLFLGNSPMRDSILVIAFLAPVAAILIWIGLQMSALRRRGIVPATILSAIGCLGVPVGPFLYGYFLYCIHCKKGKYIFSDEYQGVIAATPAIRYRISRVLKVALWVLGIVLGLVILAIFMDGLYTPPR